MKKKYTKRQLHQLEREMWDMNRWEEADHVVTYKGPTSVRFSAALLRKLHALARARSTPISTLVNEFVKPFVESEFTLLQRMK